MDKCFKKAACFTDIHFGAKHNSIEHNEMCSTFIDWFIEKSKENGAETCIFLGDWHHVRSNVNVSTMNYTLKCLQKLNDSFEKIYFIVGNHDMYYKDSRDTNSVKFSELFENIILIDNRLTVGDVTFIPWMVDEEWKAVEKVRSKYVFGHFEIPHFKMNAMMEMPDNGEIQMDHFKNQSLVFSGHFHKRQKLNNIIYIGNAFPHDYNDVWDDDRGMMLLEWGHEPAFINFEDGPKYRSMSLSHAMSNPLKYLTKNTYAKISVDIADLSFDEMIFIKEVLLGGIGAKDITIIPDTDNIEDVVTAGEMSMKMETVDQTIIQELKRIDTSTYDVNELVSIYQSLEDI